MLADEFVAGLETKIEGLAAKVHDAWWAEKKAQGFHAPIDCRMRTLAHPNKFKGTCDKCHTDMYPYEELPEKIKDYDRVTVRAVLAAIKSVS